MKVINTDDSRLTFVFSMDEARPRRGLHLPTFLTRIKERYSFQVDNLAGRAWKDPPTETIEFSSGFVPDDPTMCPIRKFNLYSDGISATCATTDLAATFLSDFLSWINEEFDFASPKPRQEIFSSMVVCEFDHDLDHYLDKYQSLINAIGQAYLSRYPKESEWGLQTFRFTPREESHFDEPKPFFLLERRANIAWSDRRYFSHASLPTAEHIELLERLESILP